MEKQKIINDRKILEEQLKNILVDFTKKNPEFVVSEIILKNEICTIAKNDVSFVSRIEVKTKIELL